MEKIEYNGVEFKSLQTIRFHRQQVRDAADNYMCTRNEIECYADYHPSMTSYEAGPFPIASPGKLPGETDRAVMENLMTPRGLLKVTSGGRVILETPALKNGGPTRYKTDVANGPFCEFASVPKQIGVRHWVVHLRFLAHTVECNQSRDDPVLSNTWSTAWSVDELHNPQKTVAGRAILRTDLMRDQELTADSFRASFFFPIPNNFVRENIEVNLSEDGRELFWSFTDTQRCYNVDSSVAAHSQIKKIDIFRTSHSTAGTPARATAEYTLARYLGGTAGPGGAASSFYDRLWNGVTFGMGEQARQMAHLPSHVLNVRADIWGDRDASVNYLTQFSLGICLYNAVTSSVPFSLTQAEVACRQELTARFVSCEITYRWADNLQARGALNPLAAGSDQGGGVVLLDSLFRDYPTINRSELFGASPRPYRTVLTQTEGQNPAPRFNVFGASGPLTLQKSVVQALLNPCQPVPAPSLDGPRS